MPDWKPGAKLITQIGVSVFILTVSSILIFGNFPDDFKKWAFGLVGVVVGYWLR